MASLIGGAVGAAIGFFVPVVGPALGFAIGSAIGGYVGQPDREGPRLDDLRQQLSVYGAPIPMEWGTNRHAGTVIWPQILEAVEHSHSESAKGGPDVNTYTYTMSFAVLVCKGPIAGIRRIWSNKKLVYDASIANEGATQDPAFGSAPRFYLGTEDQEVDPLIEATDGPSPAYLGYAYVVFEDYDVTEMNGRLPQFEFEVVTSADDATPDISNIGDAGPKVAYDPNTGYVWSVSGVANTQIDVYINDFLSEALVDHLTIVPSSTGSSMGNDITYVPALGEFWVCNSNGTDIIAINAVTHASRELDFGKSFVGLIHYCQKNGNVVLGRTNSSTGYWVIDVASEAIVHTESISGSVFGLDQILTLGDGREAFLYADNVGVYEVDGVSTALVQTYNDAAISTTAYMAADTSRDTIVIVNDTSSTILTLDLNTGIFTPHTLSMPVDAPPTASISLHRILWHSQNDKYYITAHQAGLSWTMFTVNPVTFEIEDVKIYSGPTNTGSLLEVPDHPNFLIYTDSGTDSAYKIPLFGLLDPNAVVLGDIVTDLCAEADLDASKIDVTDLTDEVLGYIVPRQMTARAAIEPLQQAFYFDAVEGEKIKFVKRGSSTTTTIPKDDRAAHIDGQEVPAHLEIRRAMDTELPVQCDVEYPDFDADHQVGNQYDRRITKDTRQRINLQIAIVMRAPKAKEIARCTLYQAWQKLTFRWVTTLKYAYLEPTDIVQLPTDDVTYRVRITSRRDNPNGLIEWEGAIEDAATYSQSGDDAITPPYQIQSIFEASTTILALMDIPLLRDEDDNAGYYAAMGGEA